MKTIKVSEATTTQLNWLVAKCEGGDVAIETNSGGESIIRYCGFITSFTTDWSESGPIIEREQISTNFGDEFDGGWCANLGFDPCSGESQAEAEGPTPLIAAMRCYVASKLGVEVEVPNEL